jgi:FKBP-type peptidyl-prolyl cis-trans isomerase FkpA
MIKQAVSIALLGSAIFSLSACKNSGSFKTTAKGLEYKIVKDVPGPKPKMGDFVEMHIVVHMQTSTGDTVLFSTYKMNNGNPTQFPMQAAQFNGDPAEGFMMLSPGDSAVFRVSVDSLKKMGGPLPPFMKSGSKLEYNVVLVSIKSKAQMQADAEQKSAAQKGNDDKILQGYFAKNHLQPSKTPAGVYYTIQAPGSGETPKQGQSVTVNYTGMTLDGKKFDSNQDSAFHHTQPFTFTLGQHGVIQGWDDGVAILKKGSKATLYIPSTLAYGPQSPSPAIPANSILMFNIDVTDIKDAAPAPTK